MGKISSAVLGIKNFRMLLLCRLLVAMALSSQAVIVGWQIYEMTKDPFMLGLTGLVEAIPAITCALFSGYVVDNGIPYKILRYCIGGLALNGLVFFLSAGHIITMPSSTLIIVIFVLLFFSGLVRGFIMPAAFSMLPQIVSRPQISEASAWQVTTFKVASITSPALAGFIYALWGPTIAWMTGALYMCVAFTMTLRITIPHTPRMEQRREPILRSIISGWKFIINNQTLLAVMTLDMFAVLFGGAVAMLPAYADQILHVGAIGLGILRASPALGAILIAIFLALRPIKILSGKTLLWVVAGFGASMILFGLSTYFWLSILFLAFSGAFDSISMVIRQTLMQLLTPDDMRGRVSSVNSMFIISSNEIGAFESGLAARFLGLVPSVVLGGCATLLVVAVTAILSPKLRKAVVNAEQN